MAPEAKFSPWPAGELAEADKAKAESIADALGELVGKRLDRPTAPSIGKLFQKRLVGRPAWIGDGQTVATLRKHVGHNENTYRVDVSDPGRDNQDPSAETFSVADPRREHSRLSPLSPICRLPGGASGKVGNVGNVSTASPGDDVNSTGPAPTAPGWRRRL